MDIIRVRELRKYFQVPVRRTGRFAAIRSLFSLEHALKVVVDGVTFSIAKGEMVGYIGPNGAGKSTTTKMLTGILVPSSGEVEVAGLVPYHDRKRLAYHIGVVFGQKTQLWWDVPVIESLRLLKEIYKIPTAAYKANLEIFHDLLDLHEFEHIPVRQLSLGQRMRADLVAALLHNPDILFLDEPTIGVDIVAKERFRSFIQTLNQERQVTVLLATHDLSDIEKVCSRIMIIDHGRIIYDGTVEDLKEQFAPYHLLAVNFADGVSDVQVEGAELVDRQGQWIRFRFDRRCGSAYELVTELAKKYPVKDISVKEPEIEAIVHEIYQRSAKSMPLLT